MHRHSPEFIARLRSGCPHAFARLVREQRSRLRAVGLRITRSPDAAEDCLQDALLCAFHSIDRFDARGDIGAWLRRVMVNTCLMRLRRERTRRTHLARLAAEPPLRPSSPCDAMLTREALAACAEALDALPERYREVLRLRAVEQLSTTETALRLGVSPGSVRVTLHRARQRLLEIVTKSRGGAVRDLVVHDASSSLAHQQRAAG